MNYLTNHYRNLCEQYQSKINILQNLLNEDAPASTFSGTGQGQQTFSDEQLRDQMKQNKRSNAFGPEISDDKQNQAYRDAQAELARRQGSKSLPGNTLKSEETPEWLYQPMNQQYPGTRPESGKGKKVTVDTLISPTPDWVHGSAKMAGVTPEEMEYQRQRLMAMSEEDFQKELEKEKQYNKTKATAPSSAPARVSTPSAAPATAPKTTPAPKEERGLGIDGEYGQFPIYPEGQEDSAYSKPAAQAPVQTGAPESAKQLANLYTARMTGGDVLGRKYSKQPESAKAEEVKIPEMGITQKSPTKYVVPESEEWEKMSPQEQLAMAQSALKNDEANKFFGGREGKKGGFLGIGGERTYRFSEDNSGQTPEETARLNRQAKMLNNLLNTQDAGAMSQQLSDIFKYNNNGNSTSSKSSETTSSGGMNQPMNLADFPKTTYETPSSAISDAQNALFAKAGKATLGTAKQIGDILKKMTTPKPTPVAPKDKEIILDKTANNMDQNNLDRWFMRLYGVDKFNTMPPKQRNAMLMQYNQSKVKR